MPKKTNMSLSPPWIEDSSLLSLKPHQAKCCQQPWVGARTDLLLILISEGIAGQLHHSEKDYLEQSSYFWFGSLQSMQKNLQRECSFSAQYIELLLVGVWNTEKTCRQEYTYMHYYRMEQNRVSKYWEELRHKYTNGVFDKQVNY